MALLDTANILDVFANRPTDNTTLTRGRVFYASDTGAAYYDTGTGWTPVASLGSGGSAGQPPIVLPAASTGVTAYTLPSVVTSPETSLYRVRRLVWDYGTDYTITTPGGVPTLNILNTTEAPATGDQHALNAV